MRCYKCNSVLSETNFCNSCGTDVTLYKKIVKMSNTYYNMGLAKARVRDLSGAADLLRRSVRIDKRNVNARNLLGLVYFEMGECVAAFTEWVISKNIKSEKNVADSYLKAVQSNPNKLNLMNQSIKKYNIALEATGQGSTDMAIIQLKKILSMNPNFLKAQQLLALLYMKDEEYDRALKILNKSILIDVNNTLTLKYLDEIKTIKQEKAKAKGKAPKKTAKANVESKEREQLSGNDVIIPKNAYREVNYGLITFINIVIGIVIGAAMVFFIVTPAKQSDVNKEYKDKINSYQDNVAMLNINVSELERQVENLKTEKSQVEAALQEVSNQKVDTAIYDVMIGATNKFLANDIVGCADVISAVDTSKLTSEAMTAMYNGLKTATYSKAGKHYYDIAYKAFNSADYATATPAFEKAVIYVTDDVGLWYSMGKCYKAQNGGVNNDQSRACFEKVIELAPGSEYAGWAESQKR